MDTGFSFSFMNGKAFHIQNTSKHNRKEMNRSLKLLSLFVLTHSQLNMAFSIFYNGETEEYSSNEQCLTQSVSFFETEMSCKMNLKK